ncbi:ABC transporter substrate-binding protein [Cytobacillus sp. NCCP-133]|uniref:ABC transporter substrate-binding protein n=1 Tax=Cytobacillus sp. NCCP-133 TaxID=766848 RepID=UPI00223106BD|nr:ABC transporter substrate-binding protein [Cytobacillus sp. NCCP-133]GLB60945.1 putative ABC transporter substrate-binding lipoprotein YvrC [Cytobacillus sp. NCCP-133]
MKKFYSLLLAMLLAAGVLAGCGESAEQSKQKAEEGQKASEEESAFPVTIKDALDNEVVIESKPERIVSMIPSNTEIAFGLGLGQEVVGVSDFDNYPAEAAEKEKIGGMEFNVEKIISLNPDLVLAHASSAHNSEAGLQQLRDAGVTVLVVNDAKSFEQVFESIEMIGIAAGVKEDAEQLVADMKSKLDEIKTKAQRIKEDDRQSVFVEVSPAPEIYTAGKDTFMDEMLSAINAENIITEEGWPKMDPEAIIERNPDVIITTHGYYTEDAVGNIISRDGWQDISAVKNKQVADVDSDMVTRSGPRIIEGVEELAKAVYPDVFK